MSDVADDGIRESMSALAAEYLASVRAHSSDMAAWARAESVGFEARLYARWREPLDLSQVILSIFREGVGFFDKNNSVAAVQEQHFMFVALLRLATGACKTFAEILCLLRGGFADGANGRWRSLHEIAGTAMFIHRAGQDTAERYVNWETIEDWRAARTLDEYASELNEEPLTAAEMANVDLARDKLLKRYGAEFGSDYGWALEGARTLDPTLKVSRIGFDQIERLSGMPHQRPYYKMACLPVHAGPKSFSLQLVRQGDFVMVGASNFGLVHAGSAACLSLLQVFGTLACCKSDDQLYVRLMALEILVDEARQKFAAIQSRILQEEHDTAGLRGTDAGANGKAE